LTALEDTGMVLTAVVETGIVLTALEDTGMVLTAEVTGIVLVWALAPSEKAKATTQDNKILLNFILI